jgi:hypothetical protein
MRRIQAVALVLGLTMAGPAMAGPAMAVKHSGTSAQSRNEQGRHGAGSPTRELLRLEDDWAAGLVRRDGALFRRLLAKGFIYTENDNMMGRDTLLRELTTGKDRVTEAHNEGMRVHSFGNTAAVTGWLVVRGRGPGGPFHRRYRFTDTWVRMDDGWRIVAAHDYLAPAGAR